VGHCDTFEMATNKALSARDFEVVDTTLLPRPTSGYTRRSSAQLRAHCRHVAQPIGPNDATDDLGVDPARCEPDRIEERRLPSRGRADG
jgi:hypothetical protein